MRGKILRGVRLGMTNQNIFAREENSRAVLFVALALLSLATGCCGPVAGLYPPEPGAPSHEIFVVNNHWHTGFVIRWSDLSPALQKDLARLDGANFIEIGWGDQDFYQAKQGTSGLAMQAMFFSRGSVLHAVGLLQDPEIHYRDFVVDLYRVRISDGGLARLNAYLEATFAVVNRDEPIELRTGLYGSSYFYRATGRYGAFHTCNNWLADGLRITGFPITPFYATTADNVGWQVRVFGRKYQSDVVVALQ